MVTCAPFPREDLGLTFFFFCVCVCVYAVSHGDDFSECYSLKFSRSSF